MTRGAGGRKSVRLSPHAHERNGIELLEFMLRAVPISERLVHETTEAITGAMARYGLEIVARRMARRRAEAIGSYNRTYVGFPQYRCALPERLGRFHELREQGLSPASIAQELGVSRQVVYGAFKRLDQLARTPRRPR